MFAWLVSVLIVRTRAGRRRGNFDLIFICFSFYTKNTTFSVFRCYFHILCHCAITATQCLLVYFIQPWLQPFFLCPPQHTVDNFCGLCITKNFQTCLKIATTYFTNVFKFYFEKKSQILSRANHMQNLVKVYSEQTRLRL